MSTPLRAAVVILSLSSLAACKQVSVRTPVASPALVVPAPDARLLIPAPPVEAPVEVPTPPDPPPATTPPPRQNNTPANRPAPPAVPTPAPVTPPPVADPPQVLQTTQKVGEMEQRARGLIMSAERDLNRIQENDLSTGGKNNYRDARSFIRQSRNALDNKNYLLAEELANKAAILAGQLVKG